MSSRGNKCRLCRRLNHPERHCPIIKRAGPEERAERVMYAGLCSNCFSTYHLVDDCGSRHSCGLCGERHHTLLCTGITQVDPPGDEESRLFPLVQVRAGHGSWTGLLTFFLSPDTVTSVIHPHSMQRFLPAAQRDRKMGPVIFSPSPPSAPQKRFDVGLEVTPNFTRPIQHQLPYEFADFISGVTPLANPWPYEPQEVDGILGGHFVHKIQRTTPVPVAFGKFKAQSTDLGWVCQGTWLPYVPPRQLLAYSLQDLNEE